MQCLILAAGEGDRMGRLCDSKPLLHVAGLPLIERSIATMQQAGISEFYVVTGHAADKVESFLRELSQRRSVRITSIRNPNWRLGNGSSLVSARESLNGPFVLTMADHLFDEAIVKLLKLFDSVDDELNLIALFPSHVDQSGTLVSVDKPLQTPLGNTEIDARAFAALARATESELLVDPLRFATEHSVWVTLAYLQIAEQIVGKKLNILPVLLGTEYQYFLNEGKVKVGVSDSFGVKLLSYSKQLKSLLAYDDYRFLVSGDLTHYGESSYGVSWKDVPRKELAYNVAKQDQFAIEPILEWQSGAALSHAIWHSNHCGDHCLLAAMGGDTDDINYSWTGYRFVITSDSEASRNVEGISVGTIDFTKGN